MLIQILIDTNNTNYNPDKYPYNEELWNIIIPNIKFLGYLAFAKAFLIVGTN